MAPKEVVINHATGRISHLVLARTEQDEDTGEWKIDEEETLKKVNSSLKRVLNQKNLKCPMIVSLDVPIFIQIYSLALRFHHFCIWLDVEIM